MAALRCAAVMRLEEELRAMLADLVQRDIMKSSRALASFGVSCDVVLFFWWG